MASIFVSHSKHDIDKVNYFSKIIGTKGITVQLMELEDMGTKYPAARITDIIRSQWDEDTRAVIVLLGKNLLNPPTETPQFTHNWVNFEVGVAAACRKPVWVFEEFGDLINFPIPYVTDYCRYELENVKHLQNIGSFFKKMVNYPQQYNLPQDRVTCVLCNAKYKIWDSDPQFNCPVCRMALKKNTKN